MTVTQYGTQVNRVLFVDEKLGMAEVEVFVSPDSEGKRTVKRDCYLHQLRADGGIKEIINAAIRRRSCPAASKTAGGATTPPRRPLVLSTKKERAAIVGKTCLKKQGLDLKDSFGKDA
jgi:hypothetical protein